MHNAACLSLLSITLLTLLTTLGCSCRTPAVTTTLAPPLTEYAIAADTPLDDVFLYDYTFYDTEPPENPWLQISPFHNLKPGDTFTLSVAIDGGYFSYITKVDLEPAEVVRSQWPTQNLYQRSVTWPETLEVRSLDKQGGHDAQTFQITIPQNVVLPAEVTLDVYYEQAVDAGSQMLINRLYDVAGGHESCTVPLGLLAGVPGDSLFQLKDWSITGGELYGFTLIMDYYAATDSLITLSDPAGNSMRIDNNTASGNTTGWPPVKPTLLCNSFQEAVVTLIDIDALSEGRPIDYTEGNTYTLEIRELYTKTLLLRKLLVFQA